MNNNATAQTEQATFTKGCLAHLEGNQFKVGIAAVVNAAMGKIIAGCSDDYEIEQAAGQAAIAYLAALKEVRKIEEDHHEAGQDDSNSALEITEYPQEWNERITYYSIVNGGDGSDRHLPVTDYANFKTEEEAISFQSNVLAEFPACRVARQGWIAEDEAGHNQVLANLFTFRLRLNTDEFAPRAKHGEVLTMQRYIDAEYGDIVAIGKGDTLHSQVAWYVEGMEYWAVCVARSKIYR